MCEDHVTLVELILDVEDEIRESELRTAELHEERLGYLMALGYGEGETCQNGTVILSLVNGKHADIRRDPR
jgi:hypothetical protein